MSQPVKISDALILDARLASEVFERSLTGQVEFWARLGRAIEPLLNGDQVLALCRKGSAEPLSALIQSVDSATGRQRVTDYLHAQPYPHYEQCAEKSSLLVRIDSDGKRTTGRFVNRQFKAVKLPKLPKSEKLRKK